jgi:hypothetical protein
MGTSSRNTDFKDPRSKNAWFRKIFGISGEDESNNKGETVPVLGTTSSTGGLV